MGNNHDGPFSWIKKKLNGDGQNDKKQMKYQYMALVLCIGAAFMLVGNVFLSNNQALEATAGVDQTGQEENMAVFGQKKTKKETATDYERAYETQLKDALEKMLGVDDVTVVVNLESTESRVLEKNTVTKRQTTDETDREGGKRQVEDASVDEQLVIIRNGEKEEPIVVETKKPEIRGVLVVARGADNIEVKKWIIEAVTRALGVPSHRVAVMPKKNKGDS
ncbi:stage III sporulation protein AG [Bacillus sp. FJAT-18017]|uniref:stage III sporulation protein AG n=1 Tax=Bacillus sp. FJAT-18017 TaxID=1705566 RepID=UPI0006AEC6C4|nr:stage III sporulation protein AG [Bacillus sp. FJAT-18017]ALC89986.1 stage III sporulation protein AG [Bacillus sp. FJAT-18017]